MTKAIDIIRDALQHLRIIDADGAVPDDDAATGLRALNMMMRTWEAEGLNLGWSDAATTQDTMPTPPEADEAIGYNLAVRLRARYGTQADPDVPALAALGVSMLRAMVASGDYARLCYPDLPEGVKMPDGGWRAGFYS